MSYKRTSAFGCHPIFKSSKGQDNNQRGKSAQQEGNIHNAIAVIKEVVGDKPSSNLRGSKACHKHEHIAHVQDDTTIYVDQVPLRNSRTQEIIMQTKHRHNSG